MSAAGSSPAAGADPATSLRELFDLSFSQAPSTDHRDAETEKALSIRIGRDLHLLRLDEISGLLADPVLTPLPTPIRALAGLAGFRGTIVAAYDLRVLLGQPATSRPRWLARTAADPGVALAFDHLDGHVTISRQRESRQREFGEAGTPGKAGRADVAVADGTGSARAVVHVPSLLDAIRQQVAPIPNPLQESQR